MSKTAVAIRHVHFEDLGLFEPVLKAAGYAIRYHDLDLDDLATLDPLAPDLLVVLGGPVGVYEDDVYPWLAVERRLLEQRLGAKRPTLGVCLGAQLIASALGAKVAPMGHKEIGFSPLTLTDEGRAGPLRHLDGVPVLHWHGDAFEIPPGARSLATTPLCAPRASPSATMCWPCSSTSRSTPRGGLNAGSPATPPNFPWRGSTRECYAGTLLAMAAS